jgi:hypothetical protein
MKSQNEELIKKHLGINTPDWVIENCKKLLVEYNTRQQTPITPKSLKEIGFKEEFSSGLFIYYLDNDRYISYNNNVKKSCIVYGIYESDEFDLYFQSTEQIQEFAKCFKAKENKC